MNGILRFTVTAQPALIIQGLKEYINLLNYRRKSENCISELNNK